MSVEAAAIVLHHFPTIPKIVPDADGKPLPVPRKQTIKCVLLGIANHDGDGGAWPSLKTLAKYAECSPDTARRALRVLEHVGAINTHIQRGGTAATPNTARPNLYDFLLACPAGCDGTTQHRNRRAAAALPVTPPAALHPTPPAALPVTPLQPCTPNRPVPSSEPSKGRSAPPSNPTPNTNPSAEQKPGKPLTWPRQCPAHQHPNPPACGPCKDARITNQAATDAAEAAAPARIICPVHPDLVTTYGNTNPQPGHDPRSECPSCRSDRIPTGPPRRTWTPDRTYVDDTRATALPPRNFRALAQPAANTHNPGATNPPPGRTTAHTPGRTPELVNA